MTDTILTPSQATEKFLKSSSKYGEKYFSENFKHIQEELPHLYLYIQDWYKGEIKKVLKIITDNELSNKSISVRVRERKKSNIIFVNKNELVGLKFQQLDIRDKMFTFSDYVCSFNSEYFVLTKIVDIEDSRLNKELIVRNNKIIKQDFENLNMVMILFSKILECCFDYNLY